MHVFSQSQLFTQVIYNKPQRPQMTYLLHVFKGYFLMSQRKSSSEHSSQVTGRVGRVSEDLYGQETSTFESTTPKFIADLLFIKTV